MSSLELHDLRRVAGAVAELPDACVPEATMRSARRQLRVERKSGLILVVSAERIANGRPRLEVAVVELPRDALAKQHIAARFD